MTWKQLPLTTDKTFPAYNLRQSLVTIMQLFCGSRMDQNLFFSSLEDIRPPCAHFQTVHKNKSGLLWVIKYHYKSWDALFTFRLKGITLAVQAGTCMRNMNVSITWVSATVFTYGGQAQTEAWSQIKHGAGRVFFHTVLHMLHNVSQSFYHKPFVLADTFLSVLRWLQLRRRCLPQRGAGPKRLFVLLPWGHLCVTQYNHPYPEQSQLQSPWSAGVLQLPYDLSASAPRWKRAPTNPFTKERRNLFPRFPALVALQQKQCFLAPLDVNLLWHQLHPRQVKPTNEATSTIKRSYI